MSRTSRGTRIRRWGVCLSAVVALSVVIAAPAQAATTRYEAENATISQGILETLHTGYSGTGYVNADNVEGSYVEFAISAPSAGTATITIRYANGTTVDRPSTVTVNGTAVATNLSFPPTTDWNTWASKSVTASVTAGTNTVRITGTTVNGPPNLDYIDVAVTPTLNPNVAPGGNFNLSVWELQLPIGSPGSPTTIPSVPAPGRERLHQSGVLLHRQERRLDDLLGSRVRCHHSELRTSPAPNCAR